MASHQPSTCSNQPHQVLSSYVTTTDALSSDTVLQHLLQSDKVNSLQTTDIPVSRNHNTQLVYTGYPPLADRPPAVESLNLHPGLTNELRTLQLEGGFQTTSDFLHHLVVSEKVKRLQLQQPVTSTCNSYENNPCTCSFTCATLPVLVNSTPSITHVNSPTTDSVDSSNHVQDTCTLDTASQTSQLCSINVEGVLPIVQTEVNPITFCPSQVNLDRRTTGESVSVSVQVNLCQCTLDGQSMDVSQKGQPKKHKGSFRSKVRKKKRCFPEEKSGELSTDIKDILVKELFQNVSSRSKKRGRNKGLHLLDYPKQRLPRDTKSAPREKQEYLCEICGATFKWKRSLIPHIWEHRNEVSVHRCPHCGTCFPYACRLKRHLIAKHPELEGGPIRCSTCGVEVQSYNTLKSHMRIHTGYKPFKCKFCPKTYKWNTGLEYHERVHTGERPFPCPHCSKAFTNKSDLTRHQTVHTGEKPHVCEKCGKGFTQSHTLKSHCKKHHPVIDNIPPTTNDNASGIVNDLHKQLNSIPQSFQSHQPSSFILSGIQDPTAASHGLEQMKFDTSSSLQGLQRQIPGIPTDREIAEVVVNMLTQ